MYDAIKRRRVHSDTQDEEDDSEEEEDSDEEEAEEGEEEEEEEEHPAYNLRKEKKQTNRYQPPMPSSKSLNENKVAHKPIESLSAFKKLLIILIAKFFEKV